MAEWFIAAACKAAVPSDRNRGFDPLLALFIKFRFNNLEDPCLAMAGPSE